MIDIRSSEDFEEFIRAPLSLVDFYAPWCGPCKVIAPHVQNFSNIYGDRIRFGKFNIDLDSSIMREYGIRGVPTLMIFSNGRPAGKALVGAHTRDEIERFILSVIGDQPLAGSEAPTPRPVDPRVAAAVPRRIPGWGRRR